jgi:hypothetical protein
VTVSFVTSNVFGSTTQTGNTLTLNFTVSGSGVVSLDATGLTTANAANYNQLDNANVGTVSSSAAYGKTFSIVVSANNGTGGATSSHVSTVGLGIVGNNGGRIDWAATAGQVSEKSIMTFNLTNLTGTTLSLSNIVIGNALNATGAVADARIKNFASSTSNYGTGSINLSTGFQAPGGGSSANITVEQAAQPTSGIPGFSINSITFDVVPEPSAALLGSLGMLALLRRRRG